MDIYSSWFTGLMFLLAAVALGLMPARLFRRGWRARLPSESKLVASDVMSRVGALHGLILALVFANAHGGNEQLRAVITQEATAADHVYYNARRFGDPQLMAATVAYIRTVIEQDWPSMRDRHALSDAGWRAWGDMLEGGLGLTPKNPRQSALATQIQADIWRIENLRQARGYQADNRIAPFFWLVAVTGIILIGALLFVHDPTPVHQLMMSAYSVYTGLVLFLIYDLTRPFDGALQLLPTAFHGTLEAIASGSF
ncbi:MAG: DUF4239 domain-containing protein [Pseudoxanthomonas sp.]